MQVVHMKLPRSGPAREALRNAGQFWTPEWIAEAMVAYVLTGDCDRIFDPAVGEGAFFRAAKKVATELGRRIDLAGTEVDPAVLHQARSTGLSDHDLSGVSIRDFVLNPPNGKFRGIVANPPYIRHHRLSPHVKHQIRQISFETIGRPLDGRAGLHIYFLIRALQLLEVGGRLAFIMPADTCEGISAPALWNWITRKYRLDAVVTFEPEASPFPRVDTNALIVFIRNDTPRGKLYWARVQEPLTQELKEWVASDFGFKSAKTITTHLRELPEALETGLSRPPVGDQFYGPALGDYAYVMRGIASGGNEFFFLTKGAARSLGITEEFLVLAIGRTRDVKGEEITKEMVAELDASGRPTQLLSLDDRPLSAFPRAVQNYLQQGQQLGLPDRALISQRRPWYKMEVRQIPPFLFAYLGRRDARFIRNLAGVVPLTGFLCVYPKDPRKEAVERLWAILRHPETIRNLTLVGKSYGSGAIKVEPRALERLPIPKTVIQELGSPQRPIAQQLLFRESSEGYAAEKKPISPRRRRRLKRRIARR